eukprot:10778530-Alexandrium_andersonii.AAC.1
MQRFKANLAGTSARPQPEESVRGQTEQTCCFAPHFHMWPNMLWANAKGRRELTLVSNAMLYTVKSYASRCARFGCGRPSPDASQAPRNHRPPVQNVHGDRHDEVVAVELVDAVLQHLDGHRVAVLHRHEAVGSVVQAQAPH